jgi:hypothetical protein
VLIEEKKKLQSKYWEDDENEEIIRVNNEIEFLGGKRMYATESIMSDHYQNFYWHVPNRSVRVSVKIEQKKFHV